MNLSKVVYSKQTDTIIKIASAIAALIVIYGVFEKYKQNIWKPDVKVLEADYDKSFARVQSGNKIYELFGDDVVAIKYGWGVKVGHDNNRIELVKNGQVVDYLT